MVNIRIKKLCEQKKHFKYVKEENRYEKYLLMSYFLSRKLESYFKLNKFKFKNIPSYKNFFK